MLPDLDAMARLSASSSNLLSKHAMVSLIASVMLAVPACGAADTDPTVVLSPPITPVNASDIIDQSFVSFAFESSSLPDYMGTIYC